MVFGGIDMKPQTLELKAGVEVLVATPGRLLDHIEAKNCVLNQVEYVVLDEADRMLDIGFLPDLQRILSLPAEAAPDAAVLGDLLARDPAPGRELSAGPGDGRGGAAERDRHQRRAALLQRRRPTTSGAPCCKLLKERSLTQALVFVNSKLGCARLARSFERDGLRTNALHGDKSQDERLKALEAFKRGEVDVLVATDVAARGLDIVDLPAVFNFDVPFNAEDYVHRIGRTGRAGASGLAVTLVSRDDTRLVADIEKLIKKKIEIEPLELDDDAPPRRAPRERSRDDEDFRPPPKPSCAVLGAHAGRAIRAAAARRAIRSSTSPTRPSATDGRAGLGESAPRRSPRGLSPNIKPKKKVAALFGGKVPEAETET